MSSMRRARTRGSILGSVDGSSVAVAAWVISAACAISMGGGEGVFLRASTGRARGEGLHSAASADRPGDAALQTRCAQAELTPKTLNLVAGSGPPRAKISK